MMVDVDHSGVSVVMVVVNLLDLFLDGRHGVLLGFNLLGQLDFDAAVGSVFDTFVESSSESFELGELALEVGL